MTGSCADTINLVSKSTLRKVTNTCKILYSYQRARVTNHAEIMGMPVSISIEPTTACNLRCPECPSGLRAFSRPTGLLDELLFKNIIDQLAPDLTYLTFYFQGEPYLHPHFLRMVGYASSKNIYTATSTNGHFLKDQTAEATVRSGLDRLIISIDGTTQDTYESYRIGGSLEKVTAGAKAVAQWKKKLRSRTPHLVLQFLVVRANENQVPEVYKLAEEIGADQVVLKTAQIYDFKFGSDLMPVNEKFSRYRKNARGTYELKNQMLNECWKMWHSCVVTWDGKVVPCCFDKDARYKLGDLSKNTFREIWEGEDYKTFRTRLFQSRNEIEICRNCTEGTKVWT